MHEIFVHQLITHSLWRNLTAAGFCLTSCFMLSSSYHTSVTHTIQDGKYTYLIFFIQPYTFLLLLYSSLTYLIQLDSYFKNNGADGLFRSDTEPVKKKKMLYMLILFCLFGRNLIGELLLYFFLFQNIYCCFAFAFLPRSNKTEVYVAHLSFHYGKFDLLCLWCCWSILN